MSARYRIGSGWETMQRCGDDGEALGDAIVFDEAHAMANAAGTKGARGAAGPSQQGRTGLKLQNALPDARIAYVSATGATTVPGLAYAGAFRIIHANIEAALKATGIVDGESTLNRSAGSPRSPHRNGTTSPST